MVSVTEHVFVLVIKHSIIGRGAEAGAGGRSLFFFCFEPQVLLQVVRHTGKFLICYTLTLDSVRIFSGEDYGVRVRKPLSYGTRGTHEGTGIKCVLEEENFTNMN